jgi:putative ABC transport system permease protein
MDFLLQDIRHGARAFLRNPGFAVVAIVTLGLGLGATTAIFSVVRAVLLAPLPWSEPDTRVMIWSRWTGFDKTWVSSVEVRDYRQRTRSLRSVAAWSSGQVNLTGSGDPERVGAGSGTANLFDVLGARALYGRGFQAGEDFTGTGAPVVVLSYSLWQRRFAGDPRALGRTLQIDGSGYQIVGIMPQGFRLPTDYGEDFEEPTELWTPLVLDPDPNERGNHSFYAAALLAPGVTPGQASAEITGLAHQLTAEGQYSPSMRFEPFAVSLVDEVLAPARPALRLLGVATALLLLIACANVANLLLARGAGRSLEISIRAAVGASRWRLVRQLFTESLVLAGVGAAGGLLLSFWTSDLLVAQLPELDFRGLHSSTDVRVLLFTAILAGASVCAFGLAPALTATRSALQPRLRETASAGGGRSRLQGIFVVAQLSLSLVLLLAAGLSLRALQKAGTIDLGFNPRQVVTASYDLTLQNYPVERRDLFRRELLARIDTMPGVSSGTIADLPPLSGTMFSTVVTSTRDGGDAVQGRAYMSSIGPRYFSTLEIPLLRGRAIGDEDRRGAPGAAVVNETLACQLWPGSDALGRIVRFDEGYSVQVIGVAHDAKYDDATEDPRPFLYLSLAQHAPLDRETLIVRTAGPSALATPLLQAHIRALDPTLPVFDVRPFETVLRDRADKQRGISALFAGFGLLALLLASLGLYGVMAYAVTRRTREIGVRLALGATPAQLTRLVAGDGVRLALTGVAVGAVLALPMASVLGALIFGVQIADLATFAGTCALLLAVAMVAAFLPARRAARLDPIVALRTE